MGAWDVTDFGRLPYRETYHNGKRLHLSGRKGTIGHMVDTRVSQEVCHVRLVRRGRLFDKYKYLPYPGRGIVSLLDNRVAVSSV